MPPTRPPRAEPKPAQKPPPIPFGRTIHFASVGRDTQGVQRALARAGHGKLGGLLPVFGPKAVRNLRGFQKDNRLDPDGVYGAKTHRKLEPFYDDYAFLLYTGKPPYPPPITIQLPSTFKPTHFTAGLDGYPAIDVFGPAGAAVGAPESGTVRRLSGHDPATGGVPGGAYGLSLYLACASGDYFLTHFGTRTVELGQKVKKGDPLGTICDSAVAHMPTSLSHIHLGFKASLL